MMFGITERMDDFRINYLEVIMYFISLLLFVDITSLCVLNKGLIDVLDELKVVYIGFIILFLLSFSLTKIIRLFIISFVAFGSKQSLSYRSQKTYSLRELRDEAIYRNNFVMYSVYVENKKHNLRRNNIKDLALFLIILIIAGLGLSNSIVCLYPTDFTNRVIFYSILLLILSLWSFRINENDMCDSKIFKGNPFMGIKGG